MPRTPPERTKANRNPDIAPNTKNTSSTYAILQNTYDPSNYYYMWKEEIKAREQLEQLVGDMQKHIA